MAAPGGAPPDPPVLVGDGFTVRPWTPQDAAALFTAVSRSAPYLRRFMPWVDGQRTPDAVRSELGQVAVRWRAGEDFRLAIVGPHGAIVGSTGFHPRGGALGPGVSEIGMWIVPEEAGRGLGRRVAAAMVRWGFDAWGWRRLEIRCQVDNGPSRRIAERLGFRWEGRLRGVIVDGHGTPRDVAVYGRLATDPEGP